MTPLRAPLCPLCEQGHVVRRVVRVTRDIIQICEQCDSLWPDGVLVGTSHVTNFHSYMAAIGLRPLWTELVLEELAHFLVPRQQQ